MNSEQEKVWQERVIPIRQVGYWVRRLTGAAVTLALLPVQVVPAVAAAAPLSLRTGIDGLSLHVQQALGRPP
ncbi:hypothetical protein [Duganella lactea]|uniref:hypothetical protein n=1 Tax=Duganella lactea TaxID=2692173 RepID=UPI0019255A33|nr:hypothetical protein [Duganella lactea]